MAASYFGFRLTYLTSSANDYIQIGFPTGPVKFHSGPFETTDTATDRYFVVFGDFNQTDEQKRSNTKALYDQINEYLNAADLARFYTLTYGEVTDFFGYLVGFNFLLTAKADRADLDLAPAAGTEAYSLFSYGNSSQQGITLNANVGNILCHGATTGSITLNASSPAPGGLTFLWNDGATSQNRTGLPVGTYGVTVTDGDGFKKSLAGIEITQPASAIVIGGTVQRTGCFGTADGAIQTTVTGGVGGYSYSWNDGATTPNRSNLRAGNYTVTVTDANGCQRSRQFTIFENNQIQATATIQEDTVTLDVSGGQAGGYTFLWNDGATTQNRSGLSAGLYSVTITDSLGCKKSVSVTITNFEFQFSRNPVLLRLKAADLATKPNLSFVAELWIEQVYLSGVFERVGNIREQPADADGGTTFDFQALLDAYLEPYLPEGKENQVSLAVSQFKRFFIKHSEKYGTPPVQGPYTQIDNNYVLLGGLSTEEASARTFFKSYLNTRKPFFTWDPDEKPAFQDQPEYLYFMPNSFTLASFRCWVRITYTDASQVAYLFHTQTGVNRFEVWAIPAGFNQLNLGQYQPAKTVAAWEIYLTDNQNAPISETRRYLLRQDYAPNRKYFLWLNSLGGFNTLVATGKTQRQLDPEATLIEKILQPGYKLSEGETITLAKNARPHLKTSTGYIPKEYQQALEDFIISELVIYYDAGRYVGGHIDPDTVTTADEAETLGFVNFTFNLPKMARYTPRL